MRISPEVRVKIAEHREAGWSYLRIAAKFGISDGAVHYHCMVAGAVSPKTRAQRTAGPQVIDARDGRQQRRFSPAEDAEIIRLREGGDSIAMIAKKIGRANTSVRMRLLALELRPDGYGVVK